MFILEKLIACANLVCFFIIMLIVGIVTLIKNIVTFSRKPNLCDACNQWRFFHGVFGFQKKCDICDKIVTNSCIKECSEFKPLRRW